LPTDQNSAFAYDRQCLAELRNAQWNLFAQ